MSAANNFTEITIPPMDSTADDITCIVNVRSDFRVSHRKVTGQSGYFFLIYSLGPLAANQSLMIVDNRNETQFKE